MNGEVSVDVEFLKTHDTDALLEHLTYYRDLCEYNKAVYTDYARVAKLHNDLFSINSLGASTVLGIISSLGDSSRIRITSMALSGYIALLSGMQRFLGFAEKSENARLIAKGFDKIERDTTQAIMYVRSGAITIDSRTFTKYVEEIQRNMATVREQAIQSPPEFATEEGKAPRRASRRPPPQPKSCIGSN